MPNRPSHIPTHTERSALQYLRSREWEIERNLLPPAGPKTIAAMLEKGWIERSPDSTVSMVRITDAGQAAFKAKIPEKR